MKDEILIINSARHFATSSDDGFIKIWDLETGDSTKQVPPNSTAKLKEKKFRLLIFSSLIVIKLK